jgi:hypothetical protein
MEVAMLKNKFILLVFSILILFSLVSCSPTLENEEPPLENTGSQEENTNETELGEILEETPTVFEALGKEYKSNKDINEIEIGTNIYDDQISLPYTYGEYKELDFVSDVLYLYVNQDEAVYEHLVSYDDSSENLIAPISKSDTNKLKKDLDSLRSQMELVDGEEMVLRLDRVTYEGNDSNTNSGHAFKIRVAISRVGATIVPWNYFSVTVFQIDNKLYAHLF